MWQRGKLLPVLNNAHQRTSTADAKGLSYITKEPLLELKAAFTNAPAPIHQEGQVNLAIWGETQRILLVLSVSCASCEEQRLKKPASSDLYCCASSTKRPLTRTSHSWGLKSALLFGKWSPWHDFLPYNIQACLCDKRARSYSQGWALGAPCLEAREERSAMQEQAGSYPVPSKPWLGLGPLYSQPRSGESL